MACAQEMCRNWSGSGCVCAVFGIEPAEACEHGKDAATCLACEASGWVDVCSGDSECTSDLHVHGCFADVGNCAAPGEHAHHNPDMTPERYAAELDAWWTARNAERKADANG